MANACGHLSIRLEWNAYDQVLGASHAVGGGKPIPLHQVDSDLVILAEDALGVLVRVTPGTPLPYVASGTS